MKKILVLPSWYPNTQDPINGSFFREQAALMAQQYDVRVLIVRFNDKPAPSKIISRPFTSFLSLFRFATFGKPKQISNPNIELFTSPPLYEFLAKYSLIGKRRKHRSKILSYTTVLGSLIDAGWRPDLIHAQSVYFAGCAALAIQRQFGIPYVVTEHMPFHLDSFPKFMRPEIKQSFQAAAKVLSLSSDKVRQLGMCDIEVEANLVFNFVDEQKFCQVAKPYLPGETLKLISIGAASHYKDHKTLIRALALLKKQGVPFKLTLIGLRVWGQKYDELVDFIHAQNLWQEITLIDKASRDEVARQLANNHIFAITSIAEGFPVSVLEALACGLFVVSTRHGGTEDILIPEAGSLFSVKDHEGIAGCIQQIYLGNITFDPAQIREFIVAKCGRDAFRNRLGMYYESAMREVHLT